MSHAARLELSSSPAAARVLAAASSALRRRGTLLAGGALLLVLAELPAAALPHVGQPLAMVLAIVTLLLQLAVGSWLRAGVLRAHRAVLTGERASAAMLVGGYDRMLPVAAVTVMKAALLGAALLAAAPGVLLVELSAPESLLRAVGLAVTAALPLAALAYLVPALLFVDWHVTLGGRRPLAALRASFEDARGRRIELLAWSMLLWAIGFAATIAGGALFGVGLLATLPLARAFTDSVLTRLYLDRRAGG